MDKYSHRLDSYDAASVQYSIAAENLIEDHFGEVNFISIRLKKDGGSIAKQDIDKLISGLRNLDNSRMVTNRHFHKFFFADDWTCKLEMPIHFVDLEDSEDVVFTSDTTSLEIVSAGLLAVDAIEKIAEEIGFTVIRGFESEEGVPVSFAFPGVQGVIFNEKCFGEIPLSDVGKNYSDDVISSVRDLLIRAKEVTSGLVLISGPVGTGKSYLIRAMLTELRERRAVICSPATQFLDKAGLLSQVSTNFSKSLIVLEDIGEVVAMDSASRYMDARSNLLNFAEGFLSLLMDTIVIVSFNYDLDKIDPAILRPGRCLANIVVKELNFDQAQSLVSFTIPKRKYSLAEVYEMRRAGNSDTVTSKTTMGFKSGG